MDRQHLLGDDAAPTSLERVLSESLDKLPQLLEGVAALRGFKFNPPDSVVPYLVAEYGLNEIADFLPDLRTALQEGIVWQRLIGTPAALHRALRWINHDGDIEEFPATKRKWWWFQVHLPFEVRNTNFVRPMTQLVKASKPLRSEFARVTSGWDVRAFQLNKHRLNCDAFLNDWSGIRRATGEPVLSLRVNQRVVTKFWPAPFVRVRVHTDITSFVRTTYQLPLHQRISIFVSSAGVIARYSEPAIQTFQNAPFVNDRFGKPASRAHIGFS